MKIGNLAAFVVVVSATFCSGVVYGSTWIVDQGGGGDFTAIQDCIDAALDGDTCQVTPGVYYENIDYVGKDLTVVCVSLGAVAIIDGSLAGPVVRFASGETPKAVLDGLTIRNGQSVNGAGIYCENSSPTIRNCTVLKNFAAEKGGGIYCANGSLSIAGSTIRENFVMDCAFADGGGIYFSGAALNVSNSTISGNAAGNSWHAVGVGGGIACFGDSLLLENSVVSGNGLWGDGGGIYIATAGARILSSIIAGNAASNGWSGGGNGGGIHGPGHRSFRRRVQPPARIAGRFSAGFGRPEFFSR